MESAGAAAALAPPGGPRVSEHARRSTDRSLVSGVAWSSGTKLLAQLSSWASTIFVARLLLPADYGLIGMATLVTGLLHLVSEFGIGLAVVNRRVTTDAQIRQLNTVALGVGVACAIVVCLSAPLVALFFRDPRVSGVLYVLSMGFVLSAVRSVPWGLLQRDLRFRALAVYEGMQAILVAALSVALAWAGFGYWTLAIASVTNAGLIAAVVLARHRVGFAVPHREDLGSALALSRSVLLQRLGWYGYSNADFLIAGRVLGTVALGVYSFAWNVAGMGSRIATLVMQVMPSILSKVQHDEAELRRYVLGVSEVLWLAVMPALTGLALVAPEFVDVVLGDKWRPIVAPLRVLLLSTSLKITVPLLNQVLIVRGDEAYSARISLVQLVVMPPAFALGGWMLGPTGIALAWLVVQPIVGSRLASRALRSIRLSPVAYLTAALMPAATGCIGMAAAVMATRLAMPSGMSPLVRLLVLVGVGGATFVTIVLLGFGGRVRAFRSTLAELRRG